MNIGKGQQMNENQAYESRTPLEIKHVNEYFAKYDPDKLYTSPAGHFLAGHRAALKDPGTAWRDSWQGMLLLGFITGVGIGVALGMFISWWVSP